MKALLIFLSISIVGVLSSNILELGTLDFEKYVGPGKPAAFVEFYREQACADCWRLAPIWKQLADSYSHVSHKIKFIMVDVAAEGKELGERYDIKMYPTLKFFPAGSLEPEQYTGAHELNEILRFVRNRSGVRSTIKVKPPAVSAVEELDVENFKEKVMDSSRNVLVAFTAPWCSHCQAMKPIYEQVSIIFNSEKSRCALARFDADKAENKDLAKEYSISSLPTLRFFPAGSSNKEPVPYDGPRSEVGFVNFLNEKCGTHRKVGGGLNDKAGRVDEWDKRIQEFLPEAGAKREEIVALLKEEIGKSTGLVSELYAKTLAKVNVEGGEAWLKKERKRLNKLLKKEDTADSKADELKIKLNILRAFAKKKHDSVTETPEAKEDISKTAREEL